MNNFTYINPTRIEFGKDKENNIGKYINEFSLKKVLILYGSNRIKNTGLFDKVIDSLKNENIEFLELDGVVSNPLLSKVKEGIQIVKENKVDAILAIGGGSVLDSAKTIAVGAKYDGDVWDFFMGKAEIKDAIAIFSILTLAATGSEMNGNAVITHDEIKEKPAISSLNIFPKVSIINPNLMTTVSKDYLAYSAVDIFAHCLDLYFSAPILPEINKGYLENILRSVYKTTNILLKNPNNYNARAEFAWASSLALCGISFCGIEGNSYPTHVIEHAMSALYNVPHGAGLAVVLPAYMKWNKELNISRYESFAKNVFNVNDASEGINVLETWFKSIGAPISLEELRISKESITDLANNSFNLAILWHVDKLYSKKVIIDILKKA